GFGRLIVKMIFVLLWALFMFLLFIATVICGVLCLILRERKRKFCANALLVCATISVALVYSANLLPKDSTTKNPALDFVRASYVRHADLAGREIEKAQYVEDMSTPWRNLALVYGECDRSTGLRRAKELLQTFRKTSPANVDLAARLCIV